MNNPLQIQPQLVRKKARKGSEIEIKNLLDSILTGFLLFNISTASIKLSLFPPQKGISIPLLHIETINAQIDQYSGKLEF